VLTAVACLVAAGPAAAKTFEPTRKDDPVPNGCRPNNCSLREALQASNSDPERDTILLRGGNPYELELPDGGGGGNDGGLYLNDGVTIRGRGAGKTTIDANGLDQVMTGVNNLQSDAFTVAALTLTDGDASAGSQNDGGGILTGSDDRLNLSRVRIAGNSAPTGGGGVAAFGKSAIRRCVFTGNSATYGGGVQARYGAPGIPELTITKTTISGNTASEGGGVDLRPAPELPVTRILASTISDNTATNKAGGILADGNPHSGGDLAEEPQLDVVNSTIADNKANNDAGGIMGDNAATVDVENSTIGFNTANNDNTGGAVAGGVYQHSNANFSVDDSVLASNNALGTGNNDDDCSATEAFSGAGNAINSQTGCIVSFTMPFNTYSASEIASFPADNGGPTETMRVPQGSVAIGFANDCPKRDQRGKLRPVNCDSGSFENKPKR
jgi:hypothetical protein